MLNAETGHTQRELVDLAAELFVGVFLAAIYILIGDSLCILCGGVVKDLVQGGAGLLAVAILAPSLVGALDFFGHYY